MPVASTSTEPTLQAAPGRQTRRQVWLIGIPVLLVLLPLFISLGLWQWNKAETKTRLQHELDNRSHDAAIAMPNTQVEAESLRYRHVLLQGQFDVARQFLVDNRLYREQAGYHVITPLRLAGSDVHVLVNRGWVAAPADHKVQPAIDTPAGPVTLSGIATLPATRFFNLAPQPSSGWEPVWQNLDLARFQRSVPYPLQPVVIHLDPDASHGYVRDWPRPDERADKHRSYALQWFGFALSSLGIFVYFLLRRP